MTGVYDEGKSLPAVSVTVTFNPEIDVVANQLASLKSWHSILVDNGSPSEKVDDLRALVSNYDNVVLLELGENLGLAAGINRGIAIARNMKPQFAAVLLLDQDSTFSPEAPDALLAAMRNLSLADCLSCCVGPTLYDRETGMSHGFHKVKGWIWGRVFPDCEHVPVSVATLNGSGMLVPVDILDHVGGMMESLFIDHVDTEWSFRAKAAGFPLYGIPSVCFNHCMGEKGRRIWILGWRLWPERSPLRHYFLFRNTLRLIGLNHVPLVWKLWSIVRMALDFVITSIYDSRRILQINMMLRGLREGFRSKT